MGEGAVTDKVFLYTESQKPDEQMTAFEDEHGTYFMNSKDLRAVQHVEKLTALGVHSLKIEVVLNHSIIAQEPHKFTAKPLMMRQQENHLMKA